MFINSLSSGAQAARQYERSSHLLPRCLLALHLPLSAVRALAMLPCQGAVTSAIIAALPAADRDSQVCQDKRRW